jgi:ABC-type ATPase involved in cell division
MHRDQRPLQALPGGVQALDRVSLARGVHLGEYSGGMKQRFGIAAALIGQPRLNPQAVVRELAGCVRRRAVRKEDLAALERTHRVPSTRLLAGQTLARVHSSEHPGDGFEPVEPGLEDVYFAALKGFGRPLVSAEA